MSFRAAAAGFGDGMNLQKRAGRGVREPARALVDHEGVDAAADRRDQLDDDRLPGFEKFDHGGSHVVFKNGLGGGGHQAGEGDLLPDFGWSGRCLDGTDQGV